MLTILFFEPDDPEVGRRSEADCVAACEAAGLAMEHDASGNYSHARWQDAATHAWAQVDIGWPEMDDDPTADSKAYEGWRELPLRVQIPLMVPHWMCVEAGTLVEQLLAQLPGCTVLDTEDPGEEDESPAPGALDRMRLLSSWELQHAQQSEGLKDYPRMLRISSVAMWRYRRELAQGRAEHSEYEWPDVAVLSQKNGDSDSAHSTVIWADPSEPFVLPPVEYVVIPRPGASGCIPMDEVLTAAGGGVHLPCGGAVSIEPSEALTSLHAGAKLLPAERFKALADGDWSD